MGKSLNIYESQLLDKLKLADKTAFSIIFSTYYKDLVIFANTFTRNSDVSEEIVQDVFVTLWDNAGVIDIKTSLKSYLLRMVQNKCLDWLRHLKVRDKHAQNILSNPVLHENDTENYVLFSELEKNIDKVLAQMPSDVSLTFKMSKLEGLKQQEIADKLGIAVRTVEFRIAKAIAFLKEHLKDYMITLYIILLW